MRSCRQLENKVFFTACLLYIAFPTKKFISSFLQTQKKETDFYLMKLLISDWSKQNLKNYNRTKKPKRVKTDFKAHTELKILFMYD
jgi:hypothetical protein